MRIENMDLLNSIAASCALLREAETLHLRNNDTTKAAQAHEMLASLLQHRSRVFDQPLEGSPTIAELKDATTASEAGQTLARQYLIDIGWKN